jgi:hypothetical protein
VERDNLNKFDSSTDLLLEISRFKYSKVWPLLSFVDSAANSDGLKPGSARLSLEPIFFYYCLKSSSRKISMLDLAQLKKIKALKA